MDTTPFIQKPSKDYRETIDNHAVLKELETLKERLLQEEASKYIAPLDNRESLQKLEIEKDELSAIIASIGVSAIATGLTTFSVGLLGLLLAWKPMVRLEKVARLIKLMTAILEEFEPMEVEMLPLVKIRTAQPIDLIVRFPGKDFILFAIRSHGDSTVIYNENKQALYHKRRQKGISRWKPDPLTELNEQEFWLRKDKRFFFGGTAKGSRRPLAKVLVAWGETQLDEHQEHLYSKLGDQKFLFIRREQGGASYVIHQDQVIDFIRAYLAHRQSPEEAA